MYKAEMDVLTWSQFFSGCLKWTLELSQVEVASLDKQGQMGREGGGEGGLNTLDTIPREQSTLLLNLYWDQKAKTLSPYRSQRYIEKYTLSVNVTAE